MRNIKNDIIIKKNPNYLKNEKVLKKKKVSIDIIDKCTKEALSNFNFVPAPPGVCCLHKNENYQIWKFRIPNPESNKGKRGAFRLMVYFINKEKTFYLFRIQFKKETKSSDDSNDQKLIKKLLKNNFL